MFNTFFLYIEKKRYYMASRSDYVKAWKADSSRYNSDRRASYKKVTSRGQKFKPFTGQF